MGKVLPPLPPGFLAAAGSEKPPEAEAPRQRVLKEDTNAVVRVISDSDRNTEDILGVIEDLAAAKARIKALETLVEQTREEVLVDLAALRKEVSAARLPQEGSQHPPSRPGNPLSELEQIKAMLKGYGFKGTLTIEIE